MRRAGCEQARASQSNRERGEERKGSGRVRERKSDKDAQNSINFSTLLGRTDNTLHTHTTKNSLSLLNHDSLLNPKKKHFFFFPYVLYSYTHGSERASERERENMYAQSGKQSDDDDTGKCRMKIDGKMFVGLGIARKREREERDPLVATELLGRTTFYSFFSLSHTNAISHKCSLLLSNFRLICPPKKRREKDRKI
jgi:hypothetical protein